MMALRGTDIVRVPLIEGTGELKLVDARAVRRGRGLLRLSRRLGRTAVADRRRGPRRLAGSVTVPTLATSTRWGPRQQPTYADPAAVERHGRAAAPDAAAGLRRRVRRAQGQAGRGRPRRGVPAPGRRLRGDLRRRDRRQRAQQAAGAAADGGRADLRRVGAGGEARPARRPVRQAALLATRRPATASRCRPTAATRSTATRSRPRRVATTPRGWSRSTTRRRRR